LIDSHIDGHVDVRVDCRVVRGLEPRGHPGIDSPPAGASLRHSHGLSGHARSGPAEFLRDFHIRGQTNI